MKKIGIITIVDYNNYGNRLQNYALHKLLNSMNCDVVTIRNNPPVILENKHKNSFILKLKEKGIKDLISAVVKINKRKKYRDAYNRKVNRFKEFTLKHITETDYVISESSLPDNIADEFDYFVVGSDQVWNPIYRNGFSCDFLTFAPREKRVAYAPSFGVSILPYDYQEKYKVWLSEFKSLSVREDSGADIIKYLTGEEALVLVDPTIMLTKDEWISISKPSTMKPKEPYLLTYFLGEVPTDVLKLIRILSLNYDLEIVNLASYNQIHRYSTDPSEFIDYINSAQIFLTDSFHGVIFSIILEKQFIVFNRISKVPSMDSRIDTLLSKFKFTDRKWDSVKKSKDYFGAKFSHTEHIFEKEKFKTYKYLLDSLDIKEE